MEIQELMGAPISLSLETTIDGTKFYSSDILKHRFIKAFDKSSKGKHVVKEMEMLVNKKLVLPCYKSKNIFSFIKSKLTAGPEKYILGFYHVHEKRVIVLIENSVSVFGTAANNELVSTTMHECMHLAAGRNLSKFTQVFYKNLVLYYSNFISDYFKIDKVSSKKIGELIKYIAIFEKRGPSYANKELGNYFRKLQSLFSNDTKLDEQDFNQRLTNIVVALKLFIVHMPSLMKNARNYAMVFTSLNQAYLQSFGKKNLYTTPLQELISLSEVACVLAEMDAQNSSIKKIFKIVS